MDEMWSFVGSKKHQRWLWHAIDHVSGKTLAYVFGPRKDESFLKLKTLLKPFGIKNIIRITGALILGILIQKIMFLENEEHKKLNVNI